jgi:hypothetical protein
MALWSIKVEQTNSPGCFVQAHFQLEDLPEYDAVAEILAAEEYDDEEPPVYERHMSMAPTLGGMRPITATLRNWMIDAVAELTKTAATPPPLPTAVEKDKDWRVGLFVPPSAFPNEQMAGFKGGATGRIRRPSSMSLIIPEVPALPGPACMMVIVTACSSSPRLQFFTSEFPSAGVDGRSR